MTRPVRHLESRSIDVSETQVVRTGYVPVDRVRHGCRDRMAVGDVQLAYERLLHIAPRSPWPCPTGEWDGDTFVIHDGRHEHVARLMLGHTHMLVAWLDDLPAGGDPRV